MLDFSAVQRIFCLHDPFEGSSLPYTLHRLMQAPNNGGDKEKINDYTKQTKRVLCVQLKKTQSERSLSAFTCLQSVGVSKSKRMCCSLYFSESSWVWHLTFSNIMLCVLLKLTTQTQVPNSNFHHPVQVPGDGRANLSMSFPRVQSHIEDQHVKQFGFPFFFLFSCISKQYMENAYKSKYLNIFHLST